VSWLSPRLLPLHVLGVAAVTLCVFMGLWQLGVYGSKHDDSVQKSRSAKPVELLSVWGPDDAYNSALAQRPVWVQGVFTGQEYIIRRDNGRSWAVAPLRVDDTKSFLMVVRGWTDANALPMPANAVRFKATLQPSEPSSGAGWTRSLSIPALANSFDGDLFSGYAVTSDPRVTAGLEPVTPPEPHVSWTVGLRNLAYAMQWWLFGLFAVFMWWRMAAEAIAVEGVEPLDTLGE
jgi:cytochrome oxidase assembly protein ShyY1